MGKALPSAIKLQGFAKITSKHIDDLKFQKPTSKNRFSPQFLMSASSKSDGGAMEGGSQKQNRVPLSTVVSDCVKRWFQDTLKEARAGDAGMQVLVGQMYCSGYGVPKDEKQGKAWMLQASKGRTSVLKVSDKPPGYNASDSDSDGLKGDSK